MQDVVQLKAKVPQALKRQAFSVMALRGLKFSPWVREQLEKLVTDQWGVNRPEGSKAEEGSNGQK